MIYANSVLGARTQKMADYLDICAAITGRAPLAGPHLDKHAPSNTNTTTPNNNLTLSWTSFPDDCALAARFYFSHITFTLGVRLLGCCRQRLATVLLHVGAVAEALGPERDDAFAPALGYLCGLRARPSAPRSS